MGDIVNKITKVATLGLVDDVTGMEAAQDAALKGAATQAAAEQRKLDYLIEREALPQQYRDASLNKVAGLYGLEGGDEDALESLQRTPIYEAIMSGADIGEESVLANASQMGMTRSGDVAYDLTDFRSRLKNKALMESLQGVKGLAMLPSNTNQIGDTMAGIGRTIGQGQVAAGQAEQDTTGMILSGLAQGAGAYFSDARLKINVEPKGKRNGHEWFSWTWNKRAEQLGLEGQGEGVIADKVEKYLPEAIKVHKGFKTVDYDMLGV
jgi:hypothetical protein